MQTNSQDLAVPDNWASETCATGPVDRRNLSIMLHCNVIHHPFLAFTLTERNYLAN